MGDHLAENERRKYTQWILALLASIFIAVCSGIWFVAVDRTEIVTTLNNHIVRPDLHESGFEKLRQEIRDRNYITQDQLTISNQSQKEVLREIIREELDRFKKR